MDTIMTQRAKFAAEAHELEERIAENVAKLLEAE